MDFSFSAEQEQLKAAVIKFAKKELNDNILEREKQGIFNREGWDKCADFGIFRMPVPTALSGVDQDILSCMLVMQGLGYACQDGGLLFAINSHMWTCVMPILNFGSEQQKEKYIPEMCRGKIIGGHAMTEPDSGSDAFSINTRAVLNNENYVLNGTKTFISNAPIADILIIFAVTDKTKKIGGISAFIVEKDSPGLVIGKPLEKMGLSTAPTAEVFLDNCQVPAENRLGPEGSGLAIFNAEMEWERSCLFACTLGMMERQLEQCIQYSKERTQFGQAIGKFQSIAHKIVDMKLRIELSKLILYKVAWMKSKGESAPIESSIAKLFISESAVKSGLEAIQIHGGYGYMKEFGIERDLRDAIAGRIYSGTTEIQKNIIASWLGL